MNGSHLHVTCMLAFLTSGTANAGEHRLLVHLVPDQGQDPCDVAFLDALTCEGLVVEGDPATSALAYFLVTDVTSLQNVAATLSVAASPSVMESFTPCTADVVQYDIDWPGSGTGFQMAWDPPFTGGRGPEQMAVVGVAEVSLAVPGHHLGFASASTVTDGGDVDQVTFARIGLADLAGGGQGIAPCRVTPTRRSRWSTIKALFR